MESLPIATNHNHLMKLTGPFGSPIIRRSFEIDSLKFGEGKGNHVVYIPTAVQLKEEARTWVSKAHEHKKWP
jgi:hypothetical protein